MWWEFPHYFLFTLFGYLAIQTGAMWFERIEALRWWLLATTLPLSLVWFSLKHDGPVGLMEGGWAMGEGPLLPLDGRSHAPANPPCVDVVPAGVRMGARLLNRKSRALAWLNEAVYPTTSCTSTSPSPGWRSLESSA